MYGPLSPNTQAILLLTAPLLAGRKSTVEGLLTPSEYKRLAQFLRGIKREPADLLKSDASEILTSCKDIVSSQRLLRLLDRGFLLSQAVERWQSRAIWVVSRADASYPKRFKSRLKEDAPPILYGCGEPGLLDSGGLAVVGSRNVSDVLIANTEAIGNYAAKARCAVVSGGARGIDRAAMDGALEAGGHVIGVLAEGLEQAALNRKNRDYLVGGHLVLVSPYDPQAGFNVGHAMQRNKLIYAFADAALVMNSDFESGGTWAGAIEQLVKFHFTPIYVRSTGEESKALGALREKGAFDWPNPVTASSFWETVRSPNIAKAAPTIQDNAKPAKAEIGQQHNGSTNVADISPPPESPNPASVELFTKVRELSLRIEQPMTEEEFAHHLGISKIQAKEWLKHLVAEGTIAQLKKPLRYLPQRRHPLLQ